jgi:hypothetical protein
MDMHLLMLHILEETLRKHCMHSLKSRRQSTLKMLKPLQILKILLQSSHLLSVFKRKVSFHLNHSKIPRGNTMPSSSGSQHMDQVKSVTTLRSGKVIEKPTLEPCEKDDESISEGKEGVESEHCKGNTDSPPALPFAHAMTKQRKVNHNSEIFKTFKQVRINIPL